jgi:hypothetical protein
VTLPDKQDTATIDARTAACAAHAAKSEDSSKPEKDQTWMHLQQSRYTALGWASVLSPDPAGEVGHDPVTGLLS